MNSMDSIRNLIRYNNNLKEISSGQFGKIFELEFQGKKYAIKKISKNIIDYNEDLQKRPYMIKAVENEIKIQKEMNSFNNSVFLYDNFDDKDDYIFILEYCDSDLNKILKQKGFFSSQEILYIMDGLNKPLKYMHKNGLIHRDIKPHNIMIKYVDSSKTQFIAKIGDYGTSRKLKNEKANTYIGSDRYMAPEILFQIKEYSDKSDLFSIGVMMYELYFNSYPFQWTQNMLELKNNYMKKKMRNCDDKILDDLLNKLLIYEPEKRITWEEYLNHPFFKNFGEIGVLNNVQNEHQIINLYENTFARLICQYYNRLNQNTHNELSIDKCLELKNEPFYILGILAIYLKSIGITVVIENDDSPINSDIREYNKIIFQLICNGYILKKKYLLDFDLSTNRINILLNNINELNNFNAKLKLYISKIYNINYTEILVSNIIRYQNEFTAVIVIKSNFNRDIKKDELIQLFLQDQELKTLARVDIESITPIIKLSPSMLYPYEDDKNNKWSIGEKRGGEDYIPPLGWIKYGIEVLGHNFNDKNKVWISQKNKEGQWCIAYCGITRVTNPMNEKFKNDNDLKRKGKKVGVGVYCPSDPKLMEESTIIINANGEQYKVGFMVRVKPNKIRVSERNKNIWIVDGNDDELRPYGILIKKI